ncbi:MAG TPA: hypothetical protein VFI90_15230 [Rubrobacter sp.]|nr:hypothetical protein [Rubrobacter sp.]
MVSLTDRIREQGIGVQDVSLGSTPTATHAAGVTGVTEIRPGTYVFYDRMQARMGACSPGDCTAEVVATVVSRPTGDLAIIDGGCKTFATDVQPGGESLNLVGFGEVVGHPEAVLENLTEEHGMISLHGEIALRVGDTLRIIPNHVCSTVNVPEAFYLVGEDGTVEEVAVAARRKVW